jgi:transposase
VRKGSTIIMDNASFHRKARLQKIADKKGRFLLWLSPYSPVLNPIEKTWANMKHALIDSLPHYTALEDAVYQYLNI